MKFILISDSHGNKYGIEKIFKEKKFDYLFFMGDVLDDLGLYANLENVIAVSGNNDFFSRVPSEKIVEIASKKIFVTHGHKYGVKYSLDKLLEKALDIGVEYVFFGHTHKQFIEKRNDVYLINPGKFYPNANRESMGLEIEFKDEKTIIKEFVV